MENGTKVMNYRSGSLVLRAADKFLYEVNLYKHYKDRVEIADIKYYSTNKPLPDQKIETAKMDDYLLVKCVTWLAAPLDYLTKNNFIEEESGRKNSKSRTSK